MSQQNEVFQTYEFIIRFDDFERLDHHLERIQKSLDIQCNFCNNQQNTIYFLEIKGKGIYKKISAFTKELDELEVFYVLNIK